MGDREIIQVTHGNGVVVVKSPYAPEWPARAKALGGRWDPVQRVWIFDARDEARVRGVLHEIYGWGDPDTSTIRIHLLAEQVWGKELWIGGRCIVRRMHRDAPVRLGDGVILLSGGFFPRGGTRRNPELKPFPETVLEVRDLPGTLVRQLLAEPPRWAGRIEVIEDERQRSDVSPVTGWPKRRIILGQPGQKAGE